MKHQHLRGTNGKTPTKVAVEIPGIRKNQSVTEVERELF